MFRKSPYSLGSLYLLSQRVIVHKPINCQSNTSVHILAHRVPLHDLNVEVCCAVSARGVTEPVIFEETLPTPTLG
jgi:hypothetical protein